MTSDPSPLVSGRPMVGVTKNHLSSKLLTQCGSATKKKRKKKKEEKKKKKSMTPSPLVRGETTDRANRKSSSLIDIANN